MFLLHVQTNNFICEKKYSLSLHSPRMFSWQSQAVSKKVELLWGLLFHLPQSDAASV